MTIGLVYELYNPRPSNLLDIVPMNPFASYHGFGLAACILAAMLADSAEIFLLVCFIANTTSVVCTTGFPAEPSTVTIFLYRYFIFWKLLEEHRANHKLDKNTIYRFRVKNGDRDNNPSDQNRIAHHRV
jgi:hypothetical protein